MSKRNVAILIASGLLGAQAGLAAADQAFFPSNDTEVIWKPLPAQMKYLEEHAIQQKPFVPTVYSEKYYQRYYARRTSLMSSAPGAGVRVGPTPYSTPIELHKYLYVTRVAELQKEPTPCGNSFARGAEENSTWTQLLPAQVAYFEKSAPSHLAMAASTCPLPAN